MKERVSEKTRIGKLCLDSCANYGNVLQSYALQEVLERMGAQVDCLWHFPMSDHPTQANPVWRWKEWVKLLINWHGFRDNVVGGAFGWEMARMEAIYRFCQRLLHIRRTDMDMRVLAGEYDGFVVGSDQVWNPGNPAAYWPHFFLTFAPPEKRISYAASISAPEIPGELQPLYRQALAEMPFVSLRETDGARLVKELTGREVPVHLDPTLLLTAEEWAQIEERPPWFREKEHGYVLTYFLGARQPAAEGAARAAGFPVIHLLDKENFDHYVTGPEEFIYLIHHAALIYTDSFHGTVFSIHFRRPFVVCDRVQKGADRMTSRIDTLLGMFGIAGRRGTRENGYRIDNPLEMKYPDMETVLERERARSREYLTGALMTLRR